MLRAVPIFPGDAQARVRHPTAIENVDFALPQPKLLSPQSDRMVQRIGRKGIINKQGYSAIAGFVWKRIASQKSGHLVSRSDQYADRLSSICLQSALKR